ncbi:hypothetical protein RsS62_23720 [Rhizobium dioscoreae]|nr:hypothetical protein RsS62_23720 [Rhizobium dioscoreae]
MLAGNDGGAYPPRPCSAHGTSGWFGLEEDPPSNDQETALHGLNNGQDTKKASGRSGETLRLSTADYSAASETLIMSVAW